MRGDARFRASPEKAGGSRHGAGGAAWTGEARAGCIEKIYVAGLFRGFERCRAMIDQATALGFTITHDWTRTSAFGLDGKPYPKAADGGSKLSEREQRIHAIDDLEGVRHADLLVVLGGERLWGGLIEVGYALAFGTLVWVVEPVRESVFWALPQIERLASDEECIERLERQVVINGWSARV